MKHIFILLLILTFTSFINAQDNSLKVQDTLVKRSVIQPLRVFDGEAYKLTTSEGNIELKACYGVTKILKYKVKKKSQLQDKIFTERIYLIEESHNLGLFKTFEKSWKPDADGVWTDVLGLMSDQKLPKNYKRVLRQELFYGDLLFAIHIIEFTANDIKFSIEPIPSNTRKID